MLVSLASGVSTKISLCFHTSFKMPCREQMGYIATRLVWSTNAHHFVPGRNDGLHVEVAREERDDAVRYNFAIFHQDTSKIPDNRWVVSYLKARADGDLIAASGYNLLSRGQVNALRGERLSCDARGVGTHCVSKSSHMSLELLD
jgi:hypothetical protein